MKRKRQSKDIASSLAKASRYLALEDSKRGDAPPTVKLFAMLSQQGTACVETCLCEACDSQAQRRQIEIENTSYDKPVPGSWTDCSLNDVLRCVICGVDNTGERSIQEIDFSVFDDEDLGEN